MLVGAVPAGDAAGRIMRMALEGARPIDKTVLAVDGLVLAVIVAEWIRNELKDRKKERIESYRKKVILERVSALRGLMVEGQKLKESQPPHLPGQGVIDWETQVRNWTEKSRNLLGSYSSQAEAAFIHHPAIQANVYGSSPRPFVYGALEHRLGNLRNIIEKPDVYL